ncbi:radical SAM/SPASM domain-containing protein [Fibrobacter succinogenes]|uniref:Radical SAM additional 4Fe4S-binding SPASM domain-containing protein n=1 Tax=Fibrobacter succinogenes TaxID=833 RepID=A0A380RW36_FIBSU|nr:radical SAM/SPASM domain-containing protein [Fibrobacter succinogenes]PWJ37377.1 radical SAM protein with 4Fe4S-binding SPASM domain [Fibrobacter succinogenes subsp. elongatus]SUQ19624.1 radical SAM additional 4Fe4S-binding SPASM domain-containing protein [Fibrobacter succinogenes]
MNSVYIEITNVCNLHCSFCPCGKEPASRTFMDSKMFEDCITGAQEIGATSVYFHVLGEPTLHPGFAHYLKKLEQTPLKLTLTTNGTTIERTGHQILASPAVRQVNFSTHAYAELPRETAERYLQNALDFCTLAIVERPDLYINLRLWNVGAEEASSWNSYMLKRIHETFGVEVTPGHFCSRHKSFNITGRVYLHEDTRFEWPSLSERIGKEIVAGTCRALDTHIAILHDGRVVACCLDHSGQITLGHIGEQSLAEIINSPMALNIKEGFAQHELRHPFCQTCNFCKRFK